MRISGQPLFAAVAVITLAGFAVFAAAAQDLRNVTEPVIPASCTTLTAELSAPQGALSPDEEAHPDTQRIQNALDGCAKNHAVELKADSTRSRVAFLTGPLMLRPGVTLLLDRGVTLFGSRNPQDYELRPGSCGVVSSGDRGCKPLIQARQADGAGIMGEGTIDGRGGSTLLNGPAGKQVTWWQLADQAKTAGHQQCPQMIYIDRSNDFTLYRITLKNSPNFHVVYHMGDGFTAWGVKIDTPRNARNTDGIDPSSSKNVTITQSWISTGDDDVALKAGGDGPMTNVTVAHDHFYYGHGMSIGSETNGGASAVRVTDLSIDGARHGLRIKSNPARGGLVHDIVYSDICIRNVDDPLVMDPSYDPADMHFVHRASDNKLPFFTGIVLHDVRLAGGGNITLKGLDAAHPLGIQLDGVWLDSVKSYKVQSAQANVTLGPGPVNLLPSGDAVVVSGHPGNGSLPSCSGKFVPFPRQ